MQYKLWLGPTLMLTAIALVVVVIMNAMNGEATGDMTISGEAKVVGLVCKDTALMHPALTNTYVTSHVNTITANFRDDKLSSISLIYEGDYETEQKAKEAENSDRVNYSLILSRKYGMREDVFSIGFSVDGAKIQMTQTARDISTINGNTVTYFLLDQGTSIAKSLDGLKKQYEAKGFACEISE